MEGRESHKMRGVNHDSAACLWGGDGKTLDHGLAGRWPWY